MKRGKIRRDKGVRKATNGEVERGKIRRDKEVRKATNGEVKRGKGDRWGDEKGERNKGAGVGITKQWGKWVQITEGRRKTGLRTRGKDYKAEEVEATENAREKERQVGSKSEGLKSREVEGLRGCKGEGEKSLGAE